MVNDVGHRIGAVIVLHRPEPDRLVGLIRAIAADLGCIFLFLNSSVSAELIGECEKTAASTPIETLGTGVNLGLGRAYNAAAASARKRGCDLLLVFDQDSDPARGMPARLAAAFDLAGGPGGRVAAVGPRPVAIETGAPYKLPKAGPGPAPGLVEVPFLISSGSLVDLAALERIGPFREDFFIDGIDIEWCFRARACGFRCLLAQFEPMPHRLGGGLIRVPIFKVHLVRQPSPRLFTYARNQVAMMRLPHVPRWWKARTAAALALRVLILFLDRFRRREISAIFRGIGAGLHDKLGEPEAASSRLAGRNCRTAC